MKPHRDRDQQFIACGATSGFGYAVVQNLLQDDVFILAVFAK